jgi:hypothetical protein
MKKQAGKELILTIAASILLISIIFMGIVLPGAYTKTLPNEYNTGALVAILLALLFRLPIFFWYLSTIKKIRRGGDKNKTGYVLMGILLIIFGLVYLDGAIAFSDNDHILYISYLMFASVFIDLLASILTFVAAFIKPQ